MIFPFQKRKAVPDHHHLLFRLTKTVMLVALLAACQTADKDPSGIPPPPAPATSAPASFTSRANLARGKAVTTSSAQADHAPELAVDGLAGYGSDWLADGPTPQWIEIDLGGEASIASIELVIGQTRADTTTHKLWGRPSAGDYRLLYEISEATVPGQVLVINPERPWEGVRYLKIETLQTPLFASWQEVQVFGEMYEASVSSEEPANIVFHNGVVLSMDDDLGIAQAIAIRGERIAALGTDEQVLALVSDATRVIDLQGRTVMPGFVDSHSHVFLHPEVAGETPETIQDRLLSAGVTTITEMGVVAEEVEYMLALDAAGELRMRVSLYLWMTSNCGEVTGTWYRSYPRSVQPGALLHIAGLKAFADGGSCQAPAVSYEYPSGIGHGDLFFSQEQMEGLISQAQAEGYQIAVHAAGDRAVEQVLNAYITVLGDQPNHLRHRIEHNSVVRPDMYLLYDQSKAVATIFGPFSTCILEGDRTKWKYITPVEFQEYEWPYRDLMLANPDTTFAWHGDVPVFALDPMRNLFGFVTRIDFRPDGSMCAPPDWVAAQTFPVETALRLMTINAAYALQRDADIGSLVPGKYADLIILSDDPLSIEPVDLIGLEVWMTMLNGEVGFCRPGREAFCP